MTARTSVTAPSYRGQEMKTSSTGRPGPAPAADFQGAVEMCNNNGACRKIEGGAMCPSYRVTREERDVTRGRANSLRLAITGQLGPDALTSERDGRDAEALRLLQGLPPRVPDRRRHGAHEDRGALRARRKARAVAARPPDRLPAALCAARGEVSGARQRARQVSMAQGVIRAPRGLERAPHAAAMARRCVRRHARLAAAPARPCRRGRERQRAARGRAARRYVQPLFRAREPRRGRHSAACGGLQGACRQARGWREAPALLRPHVPFRRPRRSGAARGRARDRGGRAVREARRAGDRA